MLVTDPHPARWIASLGGYTGAMPANPTERWTDTWSRATGSLATERCVYGIYVREVQFRKWVASDVAALVNEFPGDIGLGTYPGGWDPFCVEGTEVQHFGRWLLLYAGIGTSATNARIVQYFGTGRSFTSEPGGQSFHLDLAQLFGGPVDIRNKTSPPARSIAGAHRGALSLNLEHRMREMRLSYAQVTCPHCTCSQAGQAGTCPARALVPSSCIHDNESALINGPVGWQGARPLMNSKW